MPEVKLKHRYENGYPFIEFEGDLNLANFSTLFRLVQLSVMESDLPAIIDLSGDVSVWEELRSLRHGCRGLLGCPFGITYALFVIVSPQKRFKKLQGLLEVSCPLRCAESIQEAVDMLNKTQRDA
ncbi:hypothetical protein [Candidatus Aquicultor secundus]|uniref:hypothetical protein n=1 Tax=Candidatus Aquicultor secundus TaxID=1973895 RepID=UPI002580C1B5|nr:hypothetical protein [Candidatus Aquicultor secundus]NCO65520.1 hypothetical protein [Solirubrobacter sp.]